MQTDVLAQVFEQAPDAMILSDVDGNILLWNRAAEAMFGHPADATLGHSMDMIIPERFRAAHWAGFRRAVETGVEKYHGQVMTTRAVHADGGKVYVDLSFGMIRDTTGAVCGVLAIARPNLARNAAAS